MSIFERMKQLQRDRENKRYSDNLQMKLLECRFEQVMSKLGWDLDKTIKIYESRKSKLNGLIAILIEEKVGDIEDMWDIDSIDKNTLSVIQNYRSSLTKDEKLLEDYYDEEYRKEYYWKFLK